MHFSVTNELTRTAQAIHKQLEKNPENFSLRAILADVLAELGDEREIVQRWCCQNERTPVFFDMDNASIGIEVDARVHILGYEQKLAIFWGNSQYGKSLIPECIYSKITKDDNAMFIYDNGLWKYYKSLESAEDALLKAIKSAGVK